MAPVAFGQGAVITDLEEYFKDATSIDDVLKINYIPSVEGYEKRSELLKEKLSAVEQLPQGFPVAIEGSLSWTASDLSEEDWLIRLSDEDVKSVEAAMKSYLKNHETADRISVETFPVSDSLRTKLQKTVGHLFDHRGFAIVRGLDSSKYNSLERVVIFLGLSSYIGDKLGMQTLSRSALSHLTNLKPMYAEGVIKSPGYTNVHMSFHNDTAHIIALFVVGVADNGGASMVASSAKVYNELVVNKPHVVKALSENWKLNRFSTHEFKSSKYYDRPLLYHHDGKPILFIARRPFTGSNPGDVPMPLSLLQAEALDSIHFTAAPHAIRLELEAGDLQFLNNLAVVHSREDFKDASIGEGAQRRHIIRAFIKNEEKAYKLPEQLDGAFNEIYPDAPASELNFDINPFGELVADPVKRSDSPPPDRPSPPIGPSGANG